MSLIAIDNNVESEIEVSIIILIIGITWCRLLKENIILDIKLLNIYFFYKSSYS